MMWRISLIKYSFLTLVFHKVVQRRVWGTVGYLMLALALLQISSRLLEWKKLENRPVFDKVMPNKWNNIL